MMGISGINIKINNTNTIFFMRLPFLTNVSQSHQSKHNGPHPFSELESEFQISDYILPSWGLRLLLKDLNSGKSLSKPFREVNKESGGQQIKHIIPEDCFLKCCFSFSAFLYDISITNHQKRIGFPDQSIP
jgi:hypothetical protein